jgi:hypothetical protein
MSMSCGIRGAGIDGIGVAARSGLACGVGGIGKVFMLVSSVMLLQRSHGWIRGRC